MHGKFMKIIKYTIPTLTMVLIASQLMGCAAVTDKELLSMYERQEAIVIEIAQPISIEQGREVDIVWTELAFMNNYKEYFTNTFVSLTYKVNMDKGMFISQEFNNWYEKYKQRLNSQSNSSEEVYNLMKNSNPVIIPRNHKVEEALYYAENGDLTFINNLLSAIKNPYKYNENLKQYQEGQSPSCSPYRTYCGT